jgi:hypothetical protein
LFVPPAEQPLISRATEKSAEIRPKPIATNEKSDIA